MKRMKLFPKTFLYSLLLMLLVSGIAHLMTYFLATRMQLDFSAASGFAENNGIALSITPASIIGQALKKALPLSLLLCIPPAVICSLFFSKGITDRIRQIFSTTEQMKALNRPVRCPVRSEDEIGELAVNINRLYDTLLSAIQNLEREKDKISETERSKADFLRAASHELKTPVTALNAILENMILGIGKYRDHSVYLPECRELTEALSVMLRDILDASKAGLSAENEKPVQTGMAGLLTCLCEPYQLIAKAHGISFFLDVSEDFQALIPPDLFRKVLSNILSNAVSYTEEGKSVSVYLADGCIIVENECEPIPASALSRLAEPFYRPDFSRSRENGGSGLGLYIVDTLLTAMDFPYSFVPIQNPSRMLFTVQLR